MSNSRKIKNTRLIIQSVLITWESFLLPITLMTLKTLWNHEIKNIVIGGLILTSITSIVVYLFGVLPTWVPKVESSIENIINYVGLSIEIPLWVVLITTFIVFSLITYVVRTEIELTNHSTTQTEESLKTVNNVIELTEIEQKILEDLKMLDGNKIKPLQLKRSLNESQLEIDRGIDHLGSKGIIDRQYNTIDGMSISLTKSGRDYVLSDEFNNSIKQRYSVNE